MLYSAYISKLRAQVGDVIRMSHLSWTGDGTSKIFELPPDAFPVLESSYTIHVDGVTKTETTDFTLDREAGILTFVTAPADTKSITLDCQSVHLQDATWIQIINDTILSLGDDFWKEFVDATSFTTTAQMLSLSLVASQANCIAVYDYWYKASSSGEWQPVENFANWRYDRDNNIIYNGSILDFTVSSQLLKIRGLKKYTLGTLTSDTIDVQDKFMTIIDFGTIARYWRYRYKNVIELISKQTQENTRTPLQELMMLSDRYVRDFENEKARLKPTKPARKIPVYLQGKGRP